MRSSWWCEMHGDLQDHWNTAYSEKTDQQVSWHQEDAQPSLDLILDGQGAKDLSVIDVGAGRSRLADALVAAGCRDLTLLDISNEALSAVRERMVEYQPTFVTADVTQWKPHRTWDVWHDRAVFHFLTETAERAAYMRRLRAATRPGSRIVMATFAEDGPRRCSGLPVQRYSAAEMSAQLGQSFTFRSTIKLTHVTPSGAPQSFRYSIFSRV